VASLSQGRTAAAQCGLFTHKSVPVIFEPPCTSEITNWNTRKLYELLGAGFLSLYSASFYKPSLSFKKHLYLAHIFITY